MSIVEFLEARIAEDELLAETASSDGASWDAVKGVGGSSGAVHAGGELTIDEDGDDSYYGGSPIVYDEGTPDSFQAEHIATHDPARVLAECEAKRTIIDAQRWTPRQRPTDAELHFRSSHPAYEYRTTEGQRKAWDDADEPPEGDGWERNTDSGRDSWDRFDFHEESYWRRLKPEAERKEWKQYIPAALKALAYIYKDHPDYQQEWAL